MFGNRERRRKGFTLAEVLVVIAIIVVLLGVTFIAASGIIASMKQNKLDTIAQDIYVAAQDRLTEMYTDTRSDYLDYDLILQEGNSTDGMFKLAEDDSSVKPSDWDTSIQYAGLNAFYNRAAASVSAILLPEGSLSPEVEENHWIIEYNATYGYIYGVYYSEKAFSPADIAEWYNSGKANAYRVYSGRKGSGVGYYGGMGVLGGKVKMTATSLNLTLNVINAEELKADLSVKVPTEYKDRSIRVRFTITGETSGNSHSPDPMVMTTLVYGYFNRQESIVFDSFNKKNNASQQFKDNSWFTGMYPGENITIKAVAEIGKAGAGQFVADTALDTAECTVTFNSLFESVDLDTNTAYVSAGRHLQNLNNISEDVDIRNVVQISNIDFKNTTPDESDDAVFWWAETYPGRNFEPVNNDRIVSFVGSTKDEDNKTVCHIINGLTIEADDTYAGLFGVLGRTGAAVHVEDVSMVGTRITGSGLTAGALAGRTVGDVDMKNVGAYLSSDDYTNKNFTTASTALDGKTVGGLIGEVANDITASECYAAEVLRGEEQVGGLFGRVAGKMTLTRSYTDCYLIAKNDSGDVGGFAAECANTSTIDNSYTAGFTIGTPDKSAGFVPSAVASVSNSYSVLNIGPNKMGQTDQNGGSGFLTTLFYPTVSGGTVTNVYYTLPSDKEPEFYGALLIGLGQRRSFSDLRSANAEKPEKTNLASAGCYRFSSVSGDTTAYNLAAGLGLTSYPYPFLWKEDGSAVLHHYGDWDGNLFEAGTLVYFEQYTDKTRGYYGAGSDYLDSGKTIVCDGYALLYKADDVDRGTSKAARITYAGAAYLVDPIDRNTDKYTVNCRDIFGAAQQGTYYFRDLPGTVTNSAGAATGAFYTYIKVETFDSEAEDGQGVSHYYFNPHFAGTVEKVEKADSPAPTLAAAAKNAVRVRTPRQLYLLSTYFTSGTSGHFGALTPAVTVKQEMELDYSAYHWTDAGFDKSITSQRPIADGTGNHSFDATYNGTGYVITGVSFLSDTLNSGMFGVIGGTGRVNNVVIAANATDGRVAGFNTAPQQRNNYAYIGVLAGNNQGIITNCAVAGYTINTDSYYSTLYAGGLVGFNNRIINNSAAETPIIAIRANACNAFIGAFTGANGGNGFVNSSYSISNLDVSRYISGTVRISGFAGTNAGTIKNAYTIAAMTVSNVQDSNVDGFTPIGGSVQSCYFLTDGTYKFVEGIYAYGQTSQTARAAHGTSELPGKGAIALDGFGKATAETTRYHNKTSVAEGDVYPYATAVKDAGGFYVHYGDWISSDVLGNSGMLYWEHEVGGANEGYHFYALDKNDTVVSTLCTSHDDGGVITEYGYGYFKLNSNQINIGTPSFGRVNASELDNFVNTAACTAISEHFSNYYQFVLYNTTDAFSETIDGMYLTGTNAYATANVDGKQYSFSPFFGATLLSGTAAPVEMQVRSIDQLQFLNWNQGYEKETISYNLVAQNPTYENIFNNSTGGNDDRTTPYYFEKNGVYSSVKIYRYPQYYNYYLYLLYTDEGTLSNWENGNATPGQNVKLYSAETKKIITPGNTKELVDQTNYRTFTYLGQANVTGTGQQSKSDAYNREVFNWKWVQTHDIKLNASVSKGFTPIAAAATSSSADKYSAVLYAWFGSSFNGQSYKIEDVNITSDAFTVGLFGVTAGAEMKNIIMYSENDAIIQRNAGPNSPEGAYSLGGLVGVVYDYVNTDAELTNCAIAGYRIIDNSKNKQTLGEANVGGLVGVCNGNLVKCSAVTSIEVNCTHRGTSGEGYTQALYGNYVRVGGLAGATLRNLTDCYTGGKISVGSGTLMENIDSDGYFVGSGESRLVSFKENANTSTSIYVAGIGGSGFAQNYTNFSNQTGHREGNPSFKNCYTYIELPKLEGTIRSISIIGSVADRYEQKNVKVTITNCYYLDSIVNKAEMLSNVPSFYYNDKVRNVYDILNSGDKYFNEMLRGSSVYLNKVFNDNENGKYDTIQLTAKTMDELSALDIGTAWAKVDVVENGATINGKYSFPGSDHELDGRNYPFPAVITQKSDATGQPVHVHYGAWPKGKGLFSSKSTITLDLLKTGADSEDVILTNYMDYHKTPIDISKLSFVFSEMDENGVVVEDLTESEIVAVTPELQSDGTVKLNILGKTEGNVTVTAVYDGVKEAEIQVTVVAEYSIKATLVTVTVDENGNVTQTQDVENPPALPEAYQQESLYWRLTAETAEGVPLELLPSDWMVEPSTMDENYDTATFLQTDDGKILLKFSSLAARMHDIQVTAKNVTGVSEQILTSSRSVELRFKVMQNPPTVTVYRYPQDAANNELVYSGTYIYQLINGTDVTYSLDKDGEMGCSSIPFDNTAATEKGYDTFKGYVLADSLHEVMDESGNPVLNPDGSVKMDYVYFTDADGNIQYYNRIDNIQRNITVYGQWTAATYSITYDTGYDSVLVADGAQTTYTVAEGITLPRLASDRVTVENRESVFAGWEVSECTETGGWSLGSRFAPEEVTEKGNSGDIAFKAVWNPVCTITYYPSGSDTPYTDAAFGTYVSYSPTITLFTPPDTDAAAGQVFVGWKLKNADPSGLLGWQQNVIYKNTIKNAGTFTGDVELEAVWGVSYDIVYRVDSSETTEAYAEGYTYAISEAAEAPDGYRFVSWKVVEIDPDANRGWTLNETFSAGQVIDNTQAQYAGRVVLEPVYELAEYTITYDSAGGTTTPEPVTYKYTDAVTIAPAVEKDECDFIGWKTNGAGSWGDQVLQAGQVLYNQNGDVTLTAQWSERKYYVVYDVNGGQMPTGENPGWTTSSDNRMVTAYTYSSGVYLVKPTRAGYTFSGWLQVSGPSDIADNSSWPHTPCLDGKYTEKTGNVFLQAQWTPNQYSITYADSAGNVLRTQEYNITTALTIDNLPAEKGYTYTGWTVEVADSSDCNWTAATVSGGNALSGLYGNVTLRCAKQAIPYTITYLNDDDSELGTQSYTVSNSVVLMSTPTHVNAEGDNKAYFFTGWEASQEDAADGNWLSQSLYVADQLIDAGKYGNVTMTAKYHTLSLMLHAGKASFTKEFFVIRDADATSFAGYFGESVPLPERTGWTLDGWYTANHIKVLNADGTIAAKVEGFTTENSFDLTSDQHLYACWTKPATVLTPTTDISDKQVAIGAEINGKLVLLKAVSSGYYGYQLTIQEITEKSGDDYLADSFTAEDAVWLAQYSEDRWGSKYYQFRIHGQYYLRTWIGIFTRRVELSTSSNDSDWTVDFNDGQIYCNRQSNKYYLHITNSPEADSSVSLQHNQSQNKISFYSVATREVPEYDTE